MVYTLSSQKQQRACFFRIKDRKNKNNARHYWTDRYRKRLCDKKDISIHESIKGKEEKDKIQR